MRDLRNYHHYIVLNSNLSSARGWANATRLVPITPLVVIVMSQHIVQWVKIVTHLQTLLPCHQVLNASDCGELLLV